MSWKLLEGKGYSTLEWSSMNEGVSDKDVEELRGALSRIPAANKLTVVLPAGTSDFLYLDVLKSLGLRKVKERDVFKKDLRETTNFPEGSLEYLLNPPRREVQRSLSLMLGSLEEANRMLDALYAEVEPNKFRIYLIRKGGKDAGICIPHIEPNTKSEGRIFFLGTTPRFRGQGLASEIHLFAAASLRLDLKADSYIGVTNTDNWPMKKVFIRNGCTKIHSIEIYSH
jgi:RimJ/RimL family protein N-acetyltransferase